VSKESLKKELEGITDFNTRAKRVNAIKSSGGEFGDMFQLELDDVKERVTNMMLQCKDNNELAGALVHRLQGIEIAKACAFTAWELQENVKEEGEED